MVGQMRETMSKATYPLKLPLSVKKAAQRPAREDEVPSQSAQVPAAARRYSLTAKGVPACPIQKHWTLPSVNVQMARHVH